MADVLAGIFFCILIAFGFYALVWGPDVDKFEKIDDRCLVNIQHDHRLFEADKPETRTIYCKETR